jgi:uncharacterized protein (DUF58 family)
VYDKLSTELQPVGLMKVRDPEVGEDRWINSSSRKAREAYRAWWNGLSEKMDAACRQGGVDSVSISTESDYVKSLLQLFQQRK